MASAYVEEYARRRGITVAEAMEHYVVKEYLKYHPEDAKEETKAVETKMVAGCGCATAEQ